MEHIAKPSEDVGEVVFGQPEERAGATGPDGSVLDRRKEDEWLEDTELSHGARPRTTEVGRPVDDVLGATLSGTEQDWTPFGTPRSRSYLRNSGFDKKRRYRVQTWGQFHFVNSNSNSNSTQFHLVNSNSNSTSNLSIPIPIPIQNRSIPIQFLLYIYIGGGKCSYIHVLYGEVPRFSPHPLFKANLPNFWVRFLAL